MRWRLQDDCTAADYVYLASSGVRWFVRLFVRLLCSWSCKYANRLINYHQLFANYSIVSVLFFRPNRFGRYINDISSDPERHSFVYCVGRFELIGFQPNAKGSP